MCPSAQPAYILVSTLEEYLNMGRKNVEINCRILCSVQKFEITQLFIDNGMIKFCQIYTSKCYASEVDLYM